MCIKPLFIFIHFRKTLPDVCLGSKDASALFLSKYIAKCYRVQNV